ncbi:hypothetical protein FRC03_010721 [Tulasnella sp. 419]|nr:hypothetical protein FRC03_010721 [Tulasnella sp. 419]
MDARLMFPYGWHPMNPARSPNGKSSNKGITRTEAGHVRYYFIDFGTASNGENSVLGESSIEGAPELSKGDEVPYDPLKVVVYMLGMTLKDSILNCTRGAEFIVEPMVQLMTMKDPDDRPTARECLSRLQDLSYSLSTRVKAHQLRFYNPKKEGFLGTFLHDFVNYLANLRKKPLQAPEAIPDIGPLYP